MEVRMYYLYRITNQVNGKFYIGQSIDPEKRWKKHLAYSKQENKPQYIHRAMAKYGVACFILEVIATCRTPEDADAVEIELVEQYDSRNPEKGYNLCRGGEGGWLGKKHSEESKEKNRQAHLGKIASEETKQKQSSSMKKKVEEGWTPKTTFTEGSEATKYWKGKHNSNGFKSGRILDPEVEEKRLSALRAKGAWNKITLPDSQSKEIQKLFSEGLSLRKISKLTDISTHLINKELKIVGLK
jgi:group I intron endonuclease